MHLFHLLPGWRAWLALLRVQSWIDQAKTSDRSTKDENDDCKPADGSSNERADA